MKYILLFFTAFVLSTSCVTTYDLTIHRDAIIKYKNLDSTAQWLELGLKKRNHKYLIYIPMEYAPILSVGDTITKDIKNLYDKPKNDSIYNFKVRIIEYEWSEKK